MSRTAKYGMGDEMDTPLTDAFQVRQMAEYKADAATPSGLQIYNLACKHSKELWEHARRLERSHAELVGALERSLSWLSSYPGGGALATYDAVRAALAKANEIGT